MTAGLAEVAWDPVPLPAPGSVPPPAGALHLWRFARHPDETAVGELRSVLTAEERALADRLVRPGHGDAAAVARGTLRHVLAGYRGGAASAVPLTPGRRGKPRLDDDTAVTFNLSHSGCWALLAVAARGDVGTDIEVMRPGRDLLGIAGSFFTVTERARLGAVPAPELPAAFYHCWVRKEAYMKLRGDGLALPTGSFEVTLPPQPAALRRGATPGDEGRLTWLGFEPAPGYAAAVVTGEPVASVTAHTITGADRCTHLPGHPAQPASGSLPMPAEAMLGGGRYGRAR